MKGTGTTFLAAGGTILEKVSDNSNKHDHGNAFGITVVVWKAFESQDIIVELHMLTMPMGVSFDPMY